MATDHPLRSWRSQHGKTQEQLATDLGVVASHLSQIENGDRSPSLALAAKLSEKTGIPIGSFVKQAEAAE